MRKITLVLVVAFALLLPNSVATVAVECAHRWPTYHVTVIDGDTLSGVIELGLGVSKFERRIRLWGVAAPEIRGVNRAEGFAARAWVQQWVADALVTGPLMLTGAACVSEPREKYGGLLVVVESSDGRILNDEIVAAGHAKPWDGRGEQP